MSRYVITGCAASGTKWASVVMRALGSPCGHQRVFRVLGTRPWRGLEGDSSFFAVGQIPEGLPVVALARNPLHVVRSLDQMSGFLTRDTRDDALTYDYIGRHRPWIVEAADRLGRIIRYVALWDQVDADLILRVDLDPPQAVADAYRHLTGRRPAAHVAGTLRRVGSGVNTHNGPRSSIGWQQISDHPDGWLIVDKARRLGYLEDR